MRAIIALSVLLGAATFGAASADLPGKPDTARVIAGSYSADPAHTMVGFRINHMGFADTFGLFGAITGTLTLDPAHLDQAQVAVRIPVRKILTTSEGLTGRLLMPGSSGDGKPDYFGPKPADALFVSTKVSPGADGMSAAVTGNLTLNGVTRPVTIASRFTGAGKGLLGGFYVGFEGTAQIKRSDFALLADMGVVGDAVDLTISATFKKN